MENITIRRATKEDCPRILELIQELAEYERAPDEVVVSIDHFIESGFGEKPVWWGFVAEEADGHIPGFALYYIRYSTWKGQRLYLEDFYVEPQKRGNNIGKLLFDAVIQDGKDRKLNGMVWQVLEWNEPALNFYRKYYNANLDYEWVNGSIDF